MYSVSHKVLIQQRQERAITTTFFYFIHKPQKWQICSLGFFLDAFEESLKAEKNLLLAVTFIPQSNIQAANM